MAKMSKALIYIWVLIAILFIFMVKYFNFIERFMACASDANGG